VHAASRHRDLANSRPAVLVARESVQYSHGSGSMDTGDTATQPGGGAMGPRVHRSCGALVALGLALASSVASPWALMSRRRHGSGNERAA